MIQNITKGGGLRGTANYVLDDKKSPERLEAGTFLSESPQDIAREAAAVRKQNERLQKSAVVHTSLSCADGEQLSSREWGDIADRYMKEMGYGDSPYFAVRHNDTEHDHIHIVALRMDYDGRSISDSQDYKRGAEVLQRLEQEYGLQQGAKTPEQSWQQEEKGIGKGQLQKMQKDPDYIPQKEQIKVAVDAGLEDGPDVKVFNERLQEAGVNIKPNISQNTGRVAGVSFERDGVACKGSDLGKGYTWKGLQDRGLQHDQELDKDYLLGVKHEQDRASKAEDSLKSAGSLDPGASAASQELAAGGSRELGADFGADSPGSGLAPGEVRAGGPESERTKLEQLGSNAEVRPGAGKEAGEGLDDSEPNRKEQRFNQAEIRGGGDANSFVDRDSSRDRISALNEGLSAGPGAGASGGRNSEQVLSRQGRSEAKHLQVKERAWGRQAQALQAEKYRITLTHAEKPGFNLGKGKGPDGGERFYTKDEVKEKVGFLAAKNAQGYNVYVTPKDDRQHHLVLDDTSREKLQELRDKGYKPAYVQETSPGNMQAVYRVGKQADDKLEREAGNKVVVKLNQAHGDPKFSGAEHPIRMAGFANRKEKYEQNGHYPYVKVEDSSGGRSANMEKVLEQHRQKLEQEKQARPQALAQERRERMQSMSPEDSGIDAAYMRHRQNIERVVDRRGLKRDESRIDYQAAQRLLRDGYKQEDCKQAIVNNSPAIGERHSNVWNFADKTVKSAEESLNKERKQELEL